MGALILFLTTFIWGTAFLAQKIGAESLGPFAMTCFRNVLGGGFLLLLILFRNRKKENSATLPSSLLPLPSLFAGVWCGVPLCAAMLAQQVGVEYTAPGISAFLTTNYMFFIPVIGIVLSRKFPRWHIWLGIALALFGTYLICMTGESMRIGKGESWTILCALLFAIQMLVVDRYSKKCDVLVMSMAQLFTCAVLCAPFLFLPSELAKLHTFSFFTFTSYFPVIYCGVFSSGIAYTLQNFGQARTSAAVAGVVLSTESVFGALSGYIVLGDRMTAAQFIGCALVFFAAVFTQIYDIIFRKRKETDHA